MIVTVRERLKHLASLRSQLATHYDLLRMQGTGAVQTQLFLERLAEEERLLARSLAQAATEDHAALNAWLPNPRDMPRLPDKLPTNLEDTLALANEIDDTMVGMFQAPRLAQSHSVREWAASVRDTLQARRKNRASIIAQAI